MAHRARRAAKNAENRAHRQDAANKPEGYCDGCQRTKWWTRRTECHWCHKLVGECCQVNDAKFDVSRGGASKPAAPFQWWLVCVECAPVRGLMGTVPGKVDRNTPRPLYCMHQANTDGPSALHFFANGLRQCHACNRWICDQCALPCPPTEPEGDTTRPLPHMCASGHSRACPQASPMQAARSR